MHNTMSEGLWDFSNRVYRKANVSQCCLTLQDHYGLDVNLLLFACWHARSRGLIERTLVEKALTFSSTWADQVVKPLRGARRWMKTQTDGDLGEDFQKLREEIKALELRCERFQEHTLEALVTGPRLVPSVEMQIASAVYNLHYILLGAQDKQTLARPLPLRNLLATLVLSALDQEPADALMHQAVSRELSAQSLDGPAFDR